MRVMIDTNILISALLFPSARMNTLMEIIIEKHQLLLSSYVVEELMQVTRHKFPHKMRAVDALLSRLPYELVYTPKEPMPGLFEIRDEKDYPVLYTAITDDVDVFITGNKDFTDIPLERPEIFTPALFFEKYG